MQRTGAREAGDSYSPADDVTLRRGRGVEKVAAPCRCHVPWYPSSHLAPGLGQKGKGGKGSFLDLWLLVLMLTRQLGCAHCPQRPVGRAMFIAAS